MRSNCLCEYITIVEIYAVSLFLACEKAKHKAMASEAPVSEIGK